MIAPGRNQLKMPRREFAVDPATPEPARALTLLLAPDGTILDLNRHMADRLGRRMEELKGTPVWPHLPQDSCGLRQALVRRVVADLQPYRHETRYRGRWYDWSLTPCLDYRGEVIGVAVVAWDITERKRAERALQRATRASGRLRNSLAAIKACPDLDSALACLVQAATDLGGMNCGAVYGIEGEEAVLRHERGLEREFIGKVARRPLSTGYIRAALDRPLEILNVTDRFPEQREFGGLHGLRHVLCMALVAENRAFGLLILGSRHADAPGGFDLEFMRILAMEVESLFLRLGVEQRLRQSQKMESLGQLAVGMAHEFNNILTPMTVDLHLLQRLGAPAGAQDRAQALLNEMEGLSRRAGEITKQLLTFSRHSVMQLRPTDLAATVSRQCKMLSRLLGDRISLDFCSVDGLPWVMADQTMIEQVLLNLCLNARDALKNGGQLRFRLAEVTSCAGQENGRNGGATGRHVCLTVADTGCGMDEVTRKRIFEPFFTTKRAGQGTGLGLATSRWIVQQHHGWVEVESRVGEGSTFRVYLPAVAPPLAAAPFCQNGASVLGKRAVVTVERESAGCELTPALLVPSG
jgi:PAS domain S-box-containing protein